MVRKRISDHAVREGLTRFLTLTLDPKKFESELTLEEKIALLYEIWRKMRVYVRRRLRKSLVFIAVMELQKNGNPHLHMLVGSYLPKEWISASWESLGGGRSTRIESVDVQRVSAYLAKYFTDESLCNLPSGTRRFSTSRGLALFERAKSEGGWVLVKLPIEYWHRHAAGIGSEEYETEQDGARSLATFVADQVMDVLANRLSGCNVPQLWVEVLSKEA